MRNQGVGSWPARRARMSPDRVAVVPRRSRAGPTASCTTGPPGWRTCSPARACATATGSPTSARTTRRSWRRCSPPACSARSSSRSTPGSPRRSWPTSCATAAPTCSSTRRRTRRGRRPLRSACRAWSVPLDEYEDAAGRGAGATRSTSRSTADETCMIMYTSGTTGRPKGVMLTHANIAWNSVNLLLDVDLASDEVTLVSAPMFHVAALNQTVLPTLLKGGTRGARRRVRPGRDAGPDRAAPGHLPVRRAGDVPGDRASRRGWADADLSSVRSVICGGAPVPEALITTYQQRGRDVHAGLRADRVPRRARCSCGPRESVTKVGSAGTPAFFTDVRVVGRRRRRRRARRAGRDPRAGPQRDGRLLAPAGRRPPRCSSRDGWLRTGDIAVVDDGRLRLHPRPDQGPDHLRRGEHLPGRGRGRALPASGGRRVRGDRRAGRAVGRGRPGGRRARAPASRSSRPSCWRSSTAGSPATRSRSRWCSPTRCRAPPPARSSRARCAHRVTGEESIMHDRPRARRAPAARRRRPRPERVAGDHPGPGEHVRRRDRRPPVDPRRRRARAAAGRSAARSPTAT